MSIRVKNQRLPIREIGGVLDKCSLDIRHVGDDYGVRSGMRKFIDLVAEPTRLTGDCISTHALPAIT